jgi:hypothetical protein
VRRREKAQKNVWNGGWIGCFVMLKLGGMDEGRNENFGFHENGGLSCVRYPAFV